MNSWLSLISNIGKLIIILSSPPPNYPALPIILISLSLNHLTNLSDLTVPTSNLVGTLGIVRRLRMVGIVRKVGMVEMVSWSTNVATQVVDVQGKYQICVVNVYSTYEKNSLEFTWICGFWETYDQRMDGPKNRHTHGQTKPFIDLLFATRNRKWSMRQWHNDRKRWKLCQKYKKNKK